MYFDAAELNLARPHVTLRHRNEGRPRKLPVGEDSRDEVCVPGTPGSAVCGQTWGRIRGLTCGNGRAAAM